METKHYSFEKVPYENLTNAPIGSGPVLTPEMEKELYEKTEDYFSGDPIYFIMKGVYMQRELHLWYRSTEFKDTESPNFVPSDLRRHIHVELDATRDDSYNTIDTSWGTYDINQTSSGKIIVSWNDHLNSEECRSLRAAIEAQDERSRLRKERREQERLRKYSK